MQGKSFAANASIASKSEQMRSVVVLANPNEFLLVLIQIAKTAIVHNIFQKENTNEQHYYNS